MREAEKAVRVRPAPLYVAEKEDLAPLDLSAAQQAHALTSRDVGKGVRGLRAAKKEKGNLQASPLSDPKWVGQDSAHNLGLSQMASPL